MVQVASGRLASTPVPNFLDPLRSWINVIVSYFTKDTRIFSQVLKFGCSFKSWDTVAFGAFELWN